MYDLAELDINIPALLAKLEDEFVDRTRSPRGLRSQSPATNSIMSCCPYHNESRRSFGVETIYPYRFHCFSCGVTGNITKLVEHALQVTPDRALHWLFSSYAQIMQDSTIDMVSLLAGDAKHRQVIPDHVAAGFCLGEPHDYLLFNRGFHSQVIRKFMYGYDETFKAVTLPIWDKKGSIRYIKKRFINPIGDNKYLNEESIYKRDILYLYHFIKQAGIRRFKLVEGEFNAASLYQAGMAALGVGSASLHEEQVALLKLLHPETVDIMYDNDAAGWKGAMKAAEAISDFAQVNIVQFNRKYNDPNDMLKAGVLSENYLKYVPLWSLVLNRRNV